MYRKQSEGWIKHFDFMVIDLLCLQLSFYLAYLLAGMTGSPYRIDLYRNMAIFITLADVLLMFFLDTLKSVLKVGWYKNFRKTLQHTIVLAGAAVGYLFLIKESSAYSRSQLILMFFLYFIFTFLARELWKRMLWKKQPAKTNSRNILLLTSTSKVNEALEKFKNYNLSGFVVCGVALVDGKDDITSIQDIPVIANCEELPSYLVDKWIDEVLVSLPNEIPYPTDLLNKIAETGITIHVDLARIPEIDGSKKFVERISDFHVLTYTLNYASGKQLLAKRTMDIFAGIVGCACTGILTILIGPIIYFSDPGPIFFSQERVGKNGQRFKIYKFRSMYKDAEQRKAELMDQNKLHDDKMFKIDFDPRVIGNKILPDGRKKTGIGEFIRKTSLDEFPQFYNVLKGEMSLVGTRPPLVNEVNAYDPRHKARLAVKPGITGLWQVSGRSNIDDFEEVVRLDKEYIQNWDIESDIKIIVKTVGVVLKREGSS